MKNTKMNTQIIIGALLLTFSLAASAAPEERSVRGSCQPAIATVVPQERGNVQLNFSRTEFAKVYAGIVRDERAAGRTPPTEREVKAQISEISVSKMASIFSPGQAVPADWVIEVACTGAWTSQWHCTLTISI